MNEMKSSIPALAAIVLILCAGGPAGADAAGGGGAMENLSVRGYVRASPIYLSAKTPAAEERESFMEYRLHKRLNLRYDPSDVLSFHWQMRTRLFAGDPVREVPGYADGITEDDGLVDLSWTVAESGDWILHYIPDRLYGEWDHGDQNVRIGRQRVNWGVNWITNPNDIFNIYSVYDFDYPERPGSDAVRIQRFLGHSSRAELAVSPGRNREESVAAALYAFRARGYDIQMIGGYYRDRIAAGGGWAGNLGGAALKGETMFYADIDSDDSGRETSLIAAVSLDYMFPNALFTIAELLYNSEGGQDAFIPAAGRLSPDNPSFSTYQASLRFSYPIHPLLDGILTAIWYPDEDAAFLSPSLRWSVTQNLDAELTGQFFVSGSDSAFENAGHLVVAALTRNF